MPNNKKILVIGSSNTDMTVKASRIPVPGETVLGGDFKMVPALKVDAVDATAAGDTFCGALCVALSEGLDKRSAAEFATRASALTVQKMGAQESIPYRNQI